NKVLLILTGKSYVGTTDGNGVASISTRALDKGTYEVTLKFAGTATRYAATTVTKKVSVGGKVPVNMKVESATSDSKSAIFKVSVKDSETGAPIVNNKVLLILTGKSYVGTTDEKGVASISTRALVKGTYEVTLKFAGTASRYASATVTKKVNVIGQTPVNMKVESAVSDKSSTVFKVSVKDSETGAPIVNNKVLLTLAGKSYVGTTDGNGVASISTGALDKGTYEVTLKFAGTATRYAAATVTKKVSVSKKIPVNMKISSAVNGKSSATFKVTVTDSENGAPVVNNKVLLVLTGKSYVGTTDNNGVATITTKSLTKGNYDVTLKFAGTATRYDQTTLTKRVEVSSDGSISIRVPVKMSFTSAISDSKSTVFKVSVTDSENGAPVVNNKVLLILSGKSYVGTTNKNGVASISTGALAKGNYDVTLKFAGTATRYLASEINTKVNVFRKIPAAMTVNDVTQGKSNTVFKVSVKDSENGAAIVNNKVLLILTGKSYVGTTDKNGVATITTRALDKGIYDITLKFAGTATRYDQTVVSQKVGVGIGKVSINTVISASKTVKNYIEKYGTLPSSVTINGVPFTTAQYLHLASQAIINLKNGDKSSIQPKFVNNPPSVGATKDLGNLRDYTTVAKRIINHEKTYNAMPSSANSDVGKIGYDGLVYAFSRVITYYGEHSVMPNYVAIKTLPSSFTPDAVNTRNTISDLSAYLRASKNCQVDNAQIKALAAKLTSGLSTPVEKATAIYNYVRDEISYSFYYDTRHGAVGTLNAKSGNCVDQAHLLNALYRASGLASRYVHGTCYFTLSGNTYGHVWTQVLIGDVWVVGDPTSNRNSFGKVVNWNTNSYSLKGYYSAISF
ncbi:transglutaminase domain-containing protein, partial [Methanobrevibacter sp.]|uniref:transglutaminase domain-containing protein n=1 Tax=Methanobrevibacter sp. TaxID=66852 RepID=UPI003890879D